jgi:hypothetical protein
MGIYRGKAMVRQEKARGVTGDMGLEMTDPMTNKFSSREDILLKELALQGIQPIRI